jgi:hypothetical protein
MGPGHRKRRRPGRPAPMRPGERQWLGGSRGVTTAGILAA